MITTNDKFGSINVKKLSERQAIQELKRLAKVISIHNINYYKYSNPKISDSEYDALWNRNKLIEERFPHLIQKDSPSLTVGSGVSDDFKKVKHIEPMLSLSNIFDENGLNEFITQVNKLLDLNNNEIIEIVTEPKIDGISASILYENGELILGSTRGNGFEGEDITENIKVVNGVPKKLNLNDIPEILEIRGEVYMKHDDFARLNKVQKKNGKQTYANPRNSAAGSLRQLNPDITAKRNLHFFAYTWGTSSNYFNSTLWEARHKIEQLGFVLNQPSKLCRNVNEILNYYNEIVEKRSSLDFDIDGVVYKLNRIDWQKKIGLRTRSPRWAVAHKLPAEKGVTVVDTIDIQVGRTGSLTPVARLKPINVGGVLITNATLHNFHEIQKKDIREGDTVVVQRAGDVIPQVVEVLFSKRKKNSKKYVFPDKCPDCGSEIISELLSTGEHEKTIRCTGGIVCSSQVLERLNHFVSLNGLNIEGLGEKQIKFFWQKSLIMNFIDIFELEKRNRNKKINISNEPGWGEQSVFNLFKSINKSRNVEMFRLIYALGIRHVGVQTAKLIANYYKNLDFFLDEILSSQDKESESYNNIISIEGIGPKIGDSIIEYFKNDKNLELTKNLLSHLNIKHVSFEGVESKLNNKIFVVTGTLQNMTRSQTKQTLEKMGAKVTSAITSKTDFLIAGSNPGSKLQKAKDINVKILSEKEFLNLLES